MAVVHLPQLLYFSAFFAGLSAAFTLAHLPDFIGAVARRHKLTCLLAGLGLAAVVQVNTLAHPYLLADNRHFTFYLWRRVFLRHWGVKFALVPGYLFSLWSMARCLKKSELVFKLVFPVCLVASLVPQHLLEFR